MPSPSSATQTQESLPAQCRVTSIFFAWAVMLLSMISATAVGKSYPIERSDSIKAPARGFAIWYLSAMARAKRLSSNHLAAQLKHETGGSVRALLVRAQIDLTI